MERNFRDYVLLLTKGMGMGAADVVPGVSGGTIAFIVGIYEELINSIKSINLETIKLFFTFKWKDFWAKINGSFLLTILSGILISVFSLAKIITYLLEEHPILVWAFFFGLVLASTYFVSKRIKKWSINRWLSFLLGIAIAYYITIATPAQTPDGYWFIFLSGAIAICAMILPGISGSFILLLMGKYKFVMEAVKEFKLDVIITFALGAGIGIILFSNVLSFLLRKYHDVTIALLTGFMLGSLNKVWPWKEIVSTDKDVEAFRNLLPNELVWQGIGLMIFGYLLVYVIETLSNKK